MTIRALPSAEMASSKFRGRAHPCVGVTIFKPPTASHEGVVSERGFEPLRGYCFVDDAKEPASYFLHATDCGQATFRQLQPGMRVAFEVFERRNEGVAARACSTCRISWPC
jgi:cold shock CspA family protein